MSLATDTTRIIRKHDRRVPLLEDDLADEGQIRQEAFREGWNARGEFDAKLVEHGAGAALIRRQNK